MEGSPKENTLYVTFEMFTYDAHHTIYHRMERITHSGGSVMSHIARHVCQSVMGVFAAMYSLGGQPTTYTATLANALTAAA